MRLRFSILVLPGLVVLTWLSGSFLPTFPLVVQQASGKDPPALETLFARDGVAFLNKHCIACHGPEKKKADLVLHVYKDDQALLKDRKTWHKVLQVLQQGEMPPPTRPRPAVEDTERFTRMVKAVFDRADRTGKRDPGRVTIRRLNRAEYNNTIRDLVGVDFQPAEDFPSDDVGHGFDNIGDVLSLSPVLMERYLAAAESVMQRAIARRSAQAAGASDGRPLAGAGSAGEPALASAQQRSAAHSLPAEHGRRIHLPLPGLGQTGRRATLRRRAARVAILANNKELKTLEVAAPEKNPAIYEVVFDAAKGRSAHGGVTAQPLHRQRRPGR